jgi:hypothetical protein
MTSEEHKLMILMFARLHEALGMISETLKSRGIWTDDDEAAFSHAVHTDDEKMLHYVSQATNDYLRHASRLGVETGLGS